MQILISVLNIFCLLSSIDQEIPQTYNTDADEDIRAHNEIDEETLSQLVVNYNSRSSSEGKSRFGPAYSVNDVEVPIKNTERMHTRRNTTWAMQLFNKWLEA